MQIRFAACAAAATLAACEGAAMNPGATVPASPITAADSLPLIWHEARRLDILCVVASNELSGREALQASLCERVRALAADGAPMPVRTVALGDPAILDRSAVVLLVHAAVQGQGAQRMLALGIRPWRAGDVDTVIFFGAAPRAVPLSGTDASTPALDAALRAALSETLPWRGAR